MTSREVYDRRRLAALCQKWGGELIEWDGKLRGDYWAQAPFADAAINWENKVIGISRSVDVGDIIHEMGHVFACDKPPNSVREEWSWLGWEIAVAKRINLRGWLRGNKYTIDITYKEKYYAELDQLISAPAARAYVFNDRINAAKEQGLLDRKNRPLSIR